MKLKISHIALVCALPMMLLACSKKSSDADQQPEAQAPELAAEAAVAEPAAEAAVAAAAETAPEQAAPQPLDMPGDKYGNGVTLTDAISVSELLARADELEGQRVRVEGEILEVCQKMGCWMNLAGDQPDSKIRIKVTDGEIIFPPAAKGRFAVAEGLVKKMALSLEDSRGYLAHEAEEQGREFDPESVKEAITIIRIDGLGAMIRDAS